MSPSRKPGGQYLGIAVIELDVQGSALVIDRDRLVQPAVLDAQVVQVTQRGAGEVAEFGGVMPLAFEFGDHDDRQNDVVLGESAQRVRIAEQDRGIDHVGAATRTGVGVGHEHSFSRGRTPPRPAPPPG